MVYKTIGILGGMGPEATAELYLRIVKIFQQEYGAKYDADFPEIVIVNLPIPDVVETSQEENAVERMLVNGVKKLETAGADFIAIPCNTVMYFLPVMRKAVSIPVLNILEETANEAKKLGLERIGIVATEMTIGKNIYGAVLGNIATVTPDVDNQRRTTQVLMNILAGTKDVNDTNFLLGLIESLQNDGAQKVILGCTELPLLIRENPSTIDTIEVLARAAVREAVKND